MHRKMIRKRNILAASIALAYAAPALATNGHVLHGVGSINQSMGGAGIATSIDAIGSNHNNVSSTSFMDQSSVEFGFELFIPDRSYSATAPTAFPGVSASGTVDSETRESPIPSMGIVYKTNSPWTLGFTALGIGGFGVDYPGVNPATCPSCNPLAVPQSAGGFGSIYANYQLLQMTPSASYQITPNWSVGAGVNIDWSSLAVNPFPATPPNASGYPDALHTATAWGWGFTLGTTYKPMPNLALGLSFKSPQWFQDFKWNSQYPDGSPATPSFKLDYPMMIGAGFSYKPIPEWMLAADLEWINYSDTDGFQESGFDSSGRVRGFGWEDIWTLGLGTQYMVTPRLALRAGYNYGQNPIKGDQQFFNVFAPAIVQHHVSLGAGYQLTKNLALNAAFYHVFENEESGPIISSGAPGFPPMNTAVPGSNVTNKLSEDSVSMQMQFKF
ncbi:OmpP1/FadL family transporter [Thermithiobacillus tepidarius]|uniref:OmpP1/FadL family transporter n=1 Tax=Thermithiobacillus tepidarius TaxID=929 RepID=UPI00041DDEC7|nr:outer membrane protein transport protein [Thermithiobacillus tepidarius]